MSSDTLKLKDVEIPLPKENELLIRVLCCGVCRTDLHVIEGDLPPGPLPLIPGHQVVGIAERAGSSVSKIKPGERIGVAWLAETCGDCGYCSAGRENLCARSRYTGYHLNGGYAEYITANENYCYKIPENFSNEEAAPLLCAGIIGYRAFKKSNPVKNGRLAIFGFGSSAHITMQIALKRGMEVFVSTRDKAHQKFAKKLGASWIGEAYELPPVPADSAIVFAPAGEIVPIALKSLLPGGTVALAGIHMSPVPELDYETCLFHEKTLCSVEANTRQDGLEFFQEASGIPVTPVIETFRLEEANAALLKLKEGLISGSAVLQIAA